MFSSQTQSCISVYHSQIDGLVEQFNKMLKNMIWKFVYNDAHIWDKWLQ